MRILLLVDEAGETVLGRREAVRLSLCAETAALGKTDHLAGQGTSFDQRCLVAAVVTVVQLCTTVTGGVFHTCGLRIIETFKIRAGRHMPNPLSLDNHISF